MSNWVVRMWERLVRRERSSGWRVPGGGVTSRGASGTGGGEGKAGTGGAGAEVVSSMGWLGGVVVSRVVSAASGGSETRVDSEERAGGN